MTLTKTKLFSAALLLGLVPSSARSEEPTLEAVIVDAQRLPDAESGAPFSISVINAEELRRAPQLRLDDILRAQVPGFSLFRRSSSRTSNPTTQGVTLRNFGPSGAGRTLVLLDGIPLNDPFAGYVLWSQVPPASLESVLVQPGGGAGLFGNAALAGTIFLVSSRLEETSAVGEASLGNNDTYELSLETSVAHAPLSLGLFAERFSTGGYPVIAAEQRGGVERNASAESDLVDLRMQWQITRDISLRVRGRWFEDERENGTAYTRNHTVGADVSAILSASLPADSGQLQVSAYSQHRKFRSTFSSVDATRDFETPALDQYNVPADAGGGSIVWSMAAGDHRFTLGGDARAVDGETNERFLWNGSQFTRLRHAGGKQLFAGLFAEDAWLLSEKMSIVGGVRLDHWELFDGFRKETERETGQVRTDTIFSDRAGDEINARLGARVQPLRTLSLRAAAYSGFRVPTLNELYRPFRVGNDVTEANPELKPERLIGGEAGVEWQATQAFRITASGFLNRVEDAVGNVTIAVGPGTFDPGGFIPAGGVLRQRQNIDSIVAPGIEAKAEWEVFPSVKLKASYLFTHPTIVEASDRALEGKLLAQTPEQVITTALEWTPWTNWYCTAQLRHSGRQFEDDQNSRVLAPFTTVDAAVAYQFSAHASVALQGENLTNQQIESGRSADGLVMIGAPRSVMLQLRWQL